MGTDGVGAEDVEQGGGGGVAGDIHMVGGRGLDMVAPGEIQLVYPPPPNHCK